MKSGTLGFFLLAVVVGAHAGAKAVVGTPSALLARMAVEKTAQSKSFTFPTLTSEYIQVNVEDYYYQEGYLSMVGRALESPTQSDFILKGGNENLYGWVVLKNRNIAYEYTTDASGFLVVEQVPVEKIFPVCETEADDHALLPAIENGPGQAGPEPHIGPYDGTPVNKFQSKPGATKVMYWDISNAPNVWPSEGMWEAWQTYSATVSMFDVNVTTDPAVYAAAAPANRGSQRQNATSGTSSCGLNAFGTSRACTIYKKSSPAYQGGTLGHEGGHNLGLSHDGSSSGAYSSGISAYQWVPIMGAHSAGIRHAQCALQYSKGEYSGANQTQDDFNIITVVRKHMPFRAKTHMGTVPLKLTGTTANPLDNRGQIVLATDLDRWSFTVGAGGGRARLAVNRTERTYGSMLDIEASIHSSSGSEVVKSNKPVNRNAEFDQALPAGTYTLAVRAGAEGTPSNGFSTYSSKGFYAIGGEITGVVPVIQAEWKNSINISPIASGGKLRLDIPLHARVESISLYTSNGKMAFNSTRRIGEINVSGLNAGNYLLSIVTNGGSVTRTVVKR